MLRVLLTNDDGIRAAGLRALTDCLREHCSVCIVAPEGPSSAKSHSITLHKPLRVEPSSLFEDSADSESPAPQAHACSGTPADCVLLALHHVYRDEPPHLVIAGINDGVNVAQDLTYSGTVGAALEGAVCGVPSWAVSLAGQENLSFTEAAQLVDLAIAVLLYGAPQARHAELLGTLARPEEPAPDCVWHIPTPGTGRGHPQYPKPVDWYPPGLKSTPCFNFNIPDLPLHEIRGFYWGVAGRRGYQDVVKPVIDPRGRPYYWVAGNRTDDDQLPGTDTYALSRGYVSVTPISYDLTSRTDLKRLSSWLSER